MKVFEESLYKEQEKNESIEKELGELKIAHHEVEEKYADVSLNFLLFVILFL